MVFTNVQFVILLIVLILLILPIHYNSNSAPSRHNDIPQNHSSLPEIPSPPRTIFSGTFNRPIELIPVATQIPSGGVQDYNYKQVGLAMTSDPGEDTVYRLMGRKYYRDPNRYEYKVLTFSGPSDNFGIPIELNNGDPMKELMTGDTIEIQGKESIGPFVVEIHDPDPIIFRTY